MEPELLQALNNLNKQFEDLKLDIKEIKLQFSIDHDRLTRLEGRQDELIRDVDKMGDKIRSLQSVVWKISLAMAGTGASAGGLAGYLFG